MSVAPAASGPAGAADLDVSDLIDMDAVQSMCVILRRKQRGRITSI
jgi:hypothetical protein